MSGSLRISTFNGALLAAYFIPAWTITAFNIIMSPIHGLYERPNISLALFVSDHLQLSGMATVRVALLLALARMTVVAFLAVFLVFTTRASMRKAGGCNEALGMALAIGSVMSFAGVVLASLAGETSALRLHAAELLMMLGTVIVMLVERPAQPQVGVAPAALTLNQT
jgi:hypothetical protein